MGGWGTDGATAECRASADSPGPLNIARLNLGEPQSILFLHVAIRMSNQTSEGEKGKQQSEEGKRKRTSSLLFPDTSAFRSLSLSFSSNTHTPRLLPAGNSARSSQITQTLPHFFDPSHGHTVMEMITSANNAGSSPSEAVRGVVNQAVLSRGPDPP